MDKSSGFHVEENCNFSIFKELAGCIIIVLIVIFISHVNYDMLMNCVELCLILCLIVHFFFFFFGAF